MTEGGMTEGWNDGRVGAPWITEALLFGTFFGTFFRTF